MHDVRPALKKFILRSGLLRLAAKAGECPIAILRYHSVLPKPEEFKDSIGTGIIHSSQAFSEQMELLSSHYHPVSLDEICAFLREELVLPPRSVAITFDDGFADNLQHAAPILARTGVAAAFYLAVDYIDNQSQPWYCRLRFAFSASDVRTWRCSNDVVSDMSLPEERHQAFVDSSKQCAVLCESALEKLLIQLETRLDVAPFSIPLMLTWEGARDLLKQGHVIGSHTLSHPNIAYIGDRDVTRELIQSKFKIEQNIDKEVRHFSYPSPILEPHHSPLSLLEAEKAGYASAVTCDPGAVRRGDNRLSLRRIYAPPTVSELEWTLENSFVGRNV